MATVTRVVGIDPGLVHTGIVGMIFDPERRLLERSIGLVAGLDASNVQDWLLDHWLTTKHASVFIEGYRPRSNLNSDRRMVEGVRDIRAATGGTVLDNMGVKKVIKRPLMEGLDVWDFQLQSHHQDLRSAARIGLLGMVKDEGLNQLLAGFVVDMHDGRPWVVR